MEMLAILACYCLIILLLSNLGGQLPSLVRMTHLRTQLLISFVGGLMLGIAFLHLFPSAVATLGSASNAGAACLAGVVAMFVLLRLFHAPHTHGFAEAIPVKLAGENEVVQPCCGEVDLGKVNIELSSEDQDVSESAVTTPNGPLQTGKIPAEHLAHHDHCEHSLHQESVDKSKDRWMGWLGILFGLWVHTFIDGVALAAGTVADSQHPGVLLAGMGTFLAIALHKPLDAFTITSTMRASGWPVLHQAVANIVFSLACPAGALLFYFGVSQGTEDSTLLGWGLAISAGFFICIALADLLPEVSFHHHDRGKLSLAFFLGIALAVLIENMPGHSHVHESRANYPYVHEVASEHSHEGTSLSGHSHDHHEH